MWRHSAPVAAFLESIETRLPDCVVLDLHMPQMDGFNVQASLARKCAALPVIIITGHDSPSARERAMEGGASAFLRKPVLDRTLLDAISAATAELNQDSTSRKSSRTCSIPERMVRDGNINPKSNNFPERSQQRPPETNNTSWVATGMAAPGIKK